MSLDLRLGGSVVAAADDLAQALGHQKAAVEHVPGKGQKVEHFLLGIGEGEKAIVINVPASVAGEFSEAIDRLITGDGEEVGVGMSDKVTTFGRAAAE